MILARPSKRILVALFLGMIWFPLLVTVLEPTETESQAERRRLAPLPEWHWDRRALNEFPRQFEAFYNDHFGLRQTLVKWFNRLRVGWLWVSPSEWVLLGDRGWLFQGGDPHIRDVRNDWPYANGELERWARILSAKRNWLAARGIDYLFVLTPNKPVIYPEHLPTAINRVRAQSRADQLIIHLTTHTDVPVLDLRPVLLRAKSILRPYHKTDTHWNDFGAYHGYRALMERLIPRHPGARLLQLATESFVIRDRPGGDLAQNLALAEILREPSIELQRPVVSCAVTKGIPADADDRIRFEKPFSTECERAGKRLLMFRDSYSLAMMPYVSESFAYVHYFPASPASLSIIEKLVAQHRPDIVIEQRASRWLRGPQG
jgi:hypothetical protein